jgi:hypothetical protein
MGDDTLYSGTVAAATEAYPVRHPGDRLFPGPHGWEQVDSAARVARDIVLRRFDAGVALPAERKYPEPAVRADGAAHRDPAGAPPPGRARDPRPGSARPRDLLDRRAGRLPRCRRGHRFPRHQPGPGVDHAAAGRPDPPRTAGSLRGTGWHERKAQHLSLAAVVRDRRRHPQAGCAGAGGDAADGDPERGTQPVGRPAPPARAGQPRPAGRHAPSAGPAPADPALRPGRHRSAARAMAARVARQGVQGPAGAGRAGNRAAPPVHRAGLSARPISTSRCRSATTRRFPSPISWRA